MSLAKKILELESSLGTENPQAVTHGQAAEMWSLAVELAKELVSETKTADPAILDSGHKVKQEAVDAEGFVPTTDRWYFMVGDVFASDNPIKQVAFVKEDEYHKAEHAIESLAIKNASLSARLEEAEERVRALGASLLAAVDALAGLADNGYDDFGGSFVNLQVQKGDVERARQIVEPYRTALKGGTDGTQA